MPRSSIAALVAAGCTVPVGAPAVAQAAMAPYHHCQPIYRRFDASLLAKRGVPCWLARVVEVAQPYGGHYLAGWHWTEKSTQEKTGRWLHGWWRQGVDGHSPAILVITIPAR